MKRILIPAFFVIDLHDDEVEKADIIADQMRSAANNLHFANAPGACVLMLDEERTNRIVPILKGETEYPHTFDWNSCRKCGGLLVAGRCNDMTCPYSDHPQDEDIQGLY